MLSNLIPVVPQEHFNLFKQLYTDSLAWTTSSSFASVVDYEAALFDPRSIWRIYVNDSEVLGLAGFHNINMIDRSADPLVGIVAEKRLNGLGLEMGWALADFGFNKLGLRRLHTMVLQDAPSRKILEKMGFTHEATFEKARFRDGVYEDVLAYRMFKKEYEKCRPQ